MSHALPWGDFRARRSVLDPDDFALSDEEPDRPPSDPIDETVWDSIVGLPDDVSIRTSEHHGTALKVQQGLLAAWISALTFEVFGEKPMDPAAHAVLDVGDELQAATYEILTGYYHQAANSLRS